MGFPLDPFVAARLIDPEIEELHLSTSPLPRLTAQSEALSHQLLPTQVSVHLLVPGYTYTKITTNSSSSSYNPSSKPAAAWSPAQVSSYLFSRITASADDFYVICPDNDVSWELDKARMQWAYEDITEGTPALSRWHPDWEEKHKAWVQEKLAKK